MGNTVHRGYFRLGVVLSVAWLAIVIAIAWYEFLSRNPFCQFDATTVTDVVCQHYFWSWVPRGKTAEFLPNILRLALAAFVPLVVGWFLGFAVGWVRKGFRSDAT
jgi:hypothetical protein